MLFQNNPAICARYFKKPLGVLEPGADAASIRNLFDAGIWPITMATTVLKPGGYQRCSQIGGLLEDIDTAA